MSGGCSVNGIPIPLVSGNSMVCRVLNEAAKKTAEEKPSKLKEARSWLADLADVRPSGASLNPPLTAIFLSIAGCKASGARALISAGDRPVKFSRQELFQLINLETACGENTQIPMGEIAKLIVKNIESYGFKNLSSAQKKAIADAIVKKFEDENKGDSLFLDDLLRKEDIEPYLGFCGLPEEKRLIENMPDIESIHIISVNELKEIVEQVKKDHAFKITEVYPNPLPAGYNGRFEIYGQNVPRVRGSDIAFNQGDTVLNNIVLKNPILSKDQETGEEFIRADITVPADTPKGPLTITIGSTPYGLNIGGDAAGQTSEAVDCSTQVAAAVATAEAKSGQAGLNVAIQGTVENAYPNTTVRLTLTGSDVSRELYLIDPKNGPKKISGSTLKVRIPNDQSLVGKPFEFTIFSLNPLAKTTLPIPVKKGIRVSNGGNGRKKPKREKCRPSQMVKIIRSKPKSGNYKCMVIGGKPKWIPK